VNVLRLDASAADRIGPRPYDVKLTSALEIAKGSGEAHAYVLYFEPGGEIGPHEAGFGQILFAVAGDGWVADEDGVRRKLAAGDAAFIPRGEQHSKGSESGLTALMIQVRDLAVVPESVVPSGPPWRLELPSHQPQGGWSG
jgi:quercetin dioxygenase-like cupin family protein